MPAGRIGSGRPAGIATHHPYACRLAATPPVRDSHGHRRKDALGLTEMETMHSIQMETLGRIESALEAAREVLKQFTPGAIETEYKIGHDPVTEADRKVDAVLRKHLLRDGEGWLSEESVDDLARLDKRRVWVVDPLDGTREFVKGLPGFCA